METLLLDADGDIVIGPSGYATVDGPAKIKQDLTYAMSEPYGSDPFHPLWGSLLAQMTGTILDPEAASLIQSEVQRVLQNYIAVQTSLLQNDLVSYDQSRFSTSDIVSQVQNIAVAVDPNDPTQAMVTVTLTTVAGDTVTITASGGSS